MIPVLFSSTATSFTTKGIGELVDAVSCVCTMSDLRYELTLVYPVDGEYYSQIQRRSIILAKPNQVDNPQPFRVYRIGKTLKGRTTFYANHISYDLSGIPVKPFTATSAADFASKLAANVAVTCPFTFSTDLTVTDNFELKEPTSARALLGGGDENTWQGKYGGEFVFNGYSVQLLRAAGQDRGVSLEYGLDLIDLQQEENISEIYTGILPYYIGVDDENEEVKVVGDVQNASGTFDFVKILPVDVSEYIAETPTKAEVNAIGQSWLGDNRIQDPQVSLTVNYAQIDQVVRQHDTVGVKFVKLGVDVKAQVWQTVFDVLLERNDRIEVGDVRPSLNDDVHDASKLKKGLLPAERIKPGSITGSAGGGGGGGGAIRKGSVGMNEIAPNSIDSIRITDGSILNTKIKDKAVSGAKIDDAAVNTIHIADDSISNTKIKNKAVGETKIDDSAVTVTKISDGAIIEAKIANNAVTGNKVLDQAIAYAKLNGTLQTFYNDTIAANAMFAGVIYAAASVSCSTLIVGGTQYVGGSFSITVDDNLGQRSYSFYGLKQAGT